MTREGRRLLRDDSGSFALEATTVLPLAMILTFLTLFFALFVSQSSVLYYGASITAERAAFGWSNSAKDAKTGAYPEGRYDGLYWRLTNDALLQGWLGLATGDGDVRVPLASAGEAANGASAKDKLAKWGATMPAAATGSIAYRNVGVMSDVTVEASAAWLPEALVRFRGQERASAKTSALVVEPTELIRTFDLIRYYSAKMKTGSEGGSLRDKAAGVLLGRKP